MGRVTVEFKEFGVLMNFTPVVRGQQRIRLRVAPEVSELDFTAAVQFQGTIVPGLRKRNTETTVEIGNGQALGGQDGVEVGGGPGGVKQPQGVRLPLPTFR